MKDYKAYFLNQIRRAENKWGCHLSLEFSTTPANNIEFSFKLSDLPTLFPAKQFKTITTWESPERNLFTGVFGVIK